MQLRHFYFISDFPILNTLPNQRKRRLRNQTLVLRHSPWSCEVSKVLRELADDRWRRLIAWSLYLAERILQQKVEIIGFPLFIIHISRLVHRHSSVAIVEQMRIQLIHAGKVAWDTLFVAARNVVYGCDVYVVVDCYLFGAFVLNGLLSSLSDDFGVFIANVAVLPVSIDDLTADLAAVLVGFLGKRLFSWVNVMD